MGWTVSEVKASSFWEFMAAWSGFVRSKSMPEKGKLSDAEANELWAFIDGEDGQVDSQMGRLPPIWNGLEFEAR